jgi:hypothetical protein
MRGRRSRNPKARPARGRRRFADAAEAFRRQRAKEESESARVDPDLKKLGANDRD